MAEDKAQSGRDKRKLKRLVKRIPAAFECPSVRGRGHIKNVSKGGLFLRTDDLPVAGSKVRVLFHSRDGSKVEVSGTVAWNTSQLDRQHDEVRPGFGMYFDAEAEGSFREFFEQLMLF